MFPQTVALTERPDGLATEVVRDAVGFDRLAGEWDALLDASASLNPFLKAGWIDSWRRHALDGAALNLLTVRDRGQLVAIAPLMRVRHALSLTDRLEFLGNGPAGSDYLDLIVRRDVEESAIDAIAASLHAQQLPLYLDHLPPASRSGRLRAVLQDRGWTAIESTPDVCPFIDLSGHTWESFLQSLGSAHRANIRRRLRALNADFDVQFRLVDSHTERRDVLSTLIHYSQARWQDDGGTSAFPNPQLVAFHHHVTRRAMDEGWLRLYVLTLNGVIGAVMYGFAIGDRFFFYQHGFDNSYARYSLGLVLMALTVRASIESGIRDFDMLYGHESYKSLWTRRHRALARLQLFPPRMTGVLLRRQVETRQALKLIAHQLGLRRHDHS